MRANTPAIGITLTGLDPLDSPRGSRRPLCSTVYLGPSRCDQLSGEPAQKNNHDRRATRIRILQQHRRGSHELNFPGIWSDTEPHAVAGPVSSASADTAAAVSLRPRVQPVTPHNASGQHTYLPWDSSRGGRPASEWIPSHRHRFRRATTTTAGSRHRHRAPQRLCPAASSSNCRRGRKRLPPCSRARGRATTSPESTGRVTSAVRAR